MKNKNVEAFLENTKTTWFEKAWSLTVDENGENSTKRLATAMKLLTPYERNGNKYYEDILSRTTENEDGTVTVLSPVKKPHLSIYDVADLAYEIILKRYSLSYGIAVELKILKNYIRAFSSEEKNKYIPRELYRNYQITSGLCNKLFVKPPNENDLFRKVRITCIPFGTNQKSYFGETKSPRQLNIWLDSQIGAFLSDGAMVIIEDIDDDSLLFKAVYQSNNGFGRWIPTSENQPFECIAKKYMGHVGYIVERKPGNYYVEIGRLADTPNEEFYRISKVKDLYIGHFEDAKRVLKKYENDFEQIFTSVNLGDYGIPKVHKDAIIF